ncbi:MAG: ORF6N domain-containing protein [Candidatus Omnitrophica bacterium]|nr:ORF6N domain-containing protein [Candidatus Omnitrophota bacterium]
MPKYLENQLITNLTIQNRIQFIRGQNVLLDRDLAELYEVKTKAINLAVKRNKQRFPEDFMFQLTRGECKRLRFQFETSKRRGGRRYLPYAFTENGIAMLSSVLRSERAIQANIEIMRTFVKLKREIYLHPHLAYQLNILEKKISKHDNQIQAIFEAIRRLMVAPEKPKRRIGFREVE